eukprot:gene20206-22959_t
MSMRLVRAPTPQEEDAPSLPVAKASSGASNMVLTLFVLVVFAVVSYAGMSGKADVSPSQTNPVYIKEDTQVLTSGLTLWSSDFHISPIADVKHNLKELGVSVIDKSLSGHCHLTNTCERDLRVIDKNNGINLQPCANALRKKFYDSYRTDPVMKSVDAYLCTHAASMCELFMPFQKPMVVIASTRYEIGRLDAVSWQRWNENLRLIAASPYNTIAANNRYDQEYIRYFTGIQDVVLLPNFCNYVNTRYQPTRPEILLGPARGVNPTVQRLMYEALTEYNKHTPNLSSGRQSGDNKGNKVIISPIRDIYTHFEYSDLAAHPAIVVLPYQVSFMSLFEFYRMQIPLFVPTPELLAKWHLDHNMLNERTWMGVLGQPQAKSILPRHSALDNAHSISGSTSSVPLSDPNNEFSYEAVLEWVKLSDFYTWPHIQTFNTWSELFAMLGDTAKLREMSERMGEFNLREEKEIKVKWTLIMEKIQRHKVSSGIKRSENSVIGGVSELPVDINDSLQQRCGYKLSQTDCNTQIAVTSTANEE